MFPNYHGAITPGAGNGWLGSPQYLRFVVLHNIRTGTHDEGIPRRLPHHRLEGVFGIRIERKTK